MTTYPPSIETPVRIMPSSVLGDGYIEMRDASGSLIAQGLAARERLTFERIAATLNAPAQAQQDRDAAALVEYTETHKLTNAQRDAVLGARDHMLSSTYERLLQARAVTPAATRPDPAPTSRGSVSQAARQPSA